MKDWYLESKDNEIYVLHGEPFTEKKKVYPDDETNAKVELFILYNENRVVGYQLKYEYDEKYPKFCTYNCFGIIYNKRKLNFKSNFEVIFEDATIRFVTYEHSPHNVRDYFLIGRWRTASESSFKELIDG